MTFRLISVLKFSIVWECMVSGCALPRPMPRTLSLSTSCYPEQDKHYREDEMSRITPKSINRSFNSHQALKWNQQHYSQLIFFIFIKIEKEYVIYPHRYVFDMIQFCCWIRLSTIVYTQKHEGIVMVTYSGAVFKDEVSGNEQQRLNWADSALTSLLRQTGQARIHVRTRLSKETVLYFSPNGHLLAHSDTWWGYDTTKCHHHHHHH